VPESRSRRKKAYTPEATAPPKAALGSASWWAPVMLALFVIGLVWIVVYYISQAAYPIGALGWWNIVVGFVFIGLGFGMSTRWK
jgi:hypothetical protein